jgi:hypothetical protein
VSEKIEDIVSDRKKLQTRKQQNWQQTITTLALKKRKKKAHRLLFHCSWTEKKRRLKMTSREKSMVLLGTELVTTSGLDDLRPSGMVKRPWRHEA